MVEFHNKLVLALSRNANTKPCVEGGTVIWALIAGRKKSHSNSRSEYYFRSDLHSQKRSKLFNRESIAPSKTRNLPLNSGVETTLKLNSRSSDRSNKSHTTTSRQVSSVWDILSDDIDVDNTSACFATEKMTDVCKQYHCWIPPPLNSNVIQGTNLTLESHLQCNVMAEDIARNFQRIAGLTDIHVRASHSKYSTTSIRNYSWGIEWRHYHFF